MLMIPVVFSSTGSAQTVNNESFDAAVAFPPAPWTSVGSTTFWSRVIGGNNPTATPHSGAGMARFNSRTSPINTQQTIATPVVDLSGVGTTDTATFSFWIFRDAGVPTAHDLMSAFINTSLTTTGATLLGNVARLRTDMLPDTQATNGWYQYTFKIPHTFLSNTNYIMLTGTSQVGNNIFLDDVRWLSFPSQCAGTPAPGTIHVTDTLICGGTGSTTLTLQGSTTGGGISYQWKSGPSATGPWTNFGTSTQSISTGTITATTYYYSKVTCAGSSLSDSTPVVHVTISAAAYPTVTISASNNANYCAGIPVVLTGNGATTYSWSPSTYLNTTTGSVVSATPVANTPGDTTRFTVIGTNAAGCSRSSNVLVTFHSTTTVNIQAIPNDTICLGQQLVLNAASGGGPNLTHFLWTPGGDTIQSITISPTVDTSYMVQVTNTWGCPSSDTLPIVVVSGSLPVINSVTSSHNGLYCIGQTPVKLVVTGTGAVTTTWSPATGLNTTSGDTVYASPGGGGPGSVLYTVTLTNAAGCSRSDTIRVRRSFPPSVNIQATPNDTICFGQCVSLFAQVTAPNDTFLWMGSGDTSQTHIACPTADSTYIVRAISSVSGCPNYDTINIVVSPTPVADFTYLISGYTVTFTNVTTGGISYVWNYGDTTGSSLPSPPPHIYTYYGSHMVTLYATNGNCTDSITHEVFLTIGVNEIDADEGIILMQNPTKDITHIQFHSDAEKAVLQVVNSLGQIVSERTLTSKGNRTFNEEIDMRTLPAGVYNIHIGTPSKNFSRKLIKM